MPLSSLAIATRPEALADALIGRLAGRRPFEGEGFACPPRLVVPNQGLGTWLKLKIAGTLGVAMHLEFCFLEEGLWRTLAELDPARKEHHRLDREQVRQMILAVLLEPTDEALGPLAAYTKNRQGRTDPRKAWQLAGRLAGLFRDYSYHRPGMVAAWLDRDQKLQESLVAAQATLYRELFGPGGLRDRWQEGGDTRHLTLPEYAARVLAGPLEAQPGRCLWIFGTSQISPFHVDLLARLGSLMEIRLYLPSALAAPLEEQGLDARERSKRFMDLSKRPSTDRAPAWRAWADAGREALFLLRALLEGPFALEVPEVKEVAGDETPGETTALGRLQCVLLGAREGPVGPPDPTLQVAACPGIQREVECVRASILWNLAQDPGLMLSDIAVLVPDMARYRPVLQAVFERGPEPLPYALADLGTGEASRYGQALLDLLELASGNFPRSAVFRVLLSPCFLAGTGLERETVLRWNEWAETLGIRHSLDPEDRRARGYQDEDFYTWRQGLRRMRLSKILSPSPEGTRHWHAVAPLADLEGADIAAVGRFSEVIETLLTRLKRLAAPGLGFKACAEAFGALAAEFLSVPADRPAEERVRARAQAALIRFAEMDGFLERCGEPQVPPLPMLAACLREMLEEPDPGRFLIGGVTLASLQPARPIPFEVIYILGLGEGGLPPQVGTLDLRAREPARGDVGPLEASSHLFLEALLSARRKLYLSYDCLDLEKDRVLYPGTLLGPLLDRIGAGAASGAYPLARVPLRPGCAALSAEVAESAGDLPAPPRGFERLLALEQGLKSGRLVLDETGRKRVEETALTFRPRLEIPPVRLEPPQTSLRISDLVEFLSNPVQAGLRRHLGLFSARSKVERDDEPFFTDNLAAYTLAEETVRMAMANPEGASKAWLDRFEQLYTARALASRNPEGAFARVDKSLLAERVARRLAAPKGLAARLAPGPGFGPLLIGEGEPRQGHLFRPGPELDVPGLGPIRIQGSFPLARDTGQGFEFLAMAGKLLDGAPFPSQILAPFLVHLCLDDARGCLVHLCHTEGVKSWRLGAIEKECARAYLEGLAADFFGPDVFDLLPLKFILTEPDLRAPFEATEEPDFPELLKEALAERGDRRFDTFQLSDLVAASSAEVPADAWAKVQRRFLPLLERLEPLEADS